MEGGEETIRLVHDAPGGEATRQWTTRREYAREFEAQLRSLLEAQPSRASVAPPSEVPPARPDIGPTDQALLREDASDRSTTVVEPPKEPSSLQPEPTTAHDAAIARLRHELRQSLTDLERAARVTGTQMDDGAFLPRPALWELIEDAGERFKLASRALHGAYRGDSEALETWTASYQEYRDERDRPPPDETDG